MARWLLIFCIFVLSVLGANGQAPGELFLQLKTAKPDTNRVRLLSQLSKYYLKQYHPGGNTKYLDSAYDFASQSLRLSKSLQSKQWQVQSLLQFIRCDEKAHNYTHAKACLTQLLTGFGDSISKEKEAELWCELGRSIKYNKKDSLQYRVECFEKARNLYNQLHQYEKGVDVFKDIADTHMQQGKIYQAENELLQVLDRYKAIGVKNLHYTYDLLAVVSEKEGDLNKELDYNIKMVKSMEATQDTSNAAYFYSNLANTYDKLGLHLKCAYYYAKALAADKRKNDVFYYYLDMRTYIRSMVEAGKAKEALAYLNKAVKEVPPVSVSNQEVINNAFGDCYAALKQHAEAETYYLKFAALYENEHNKMDDESFYFHTYFTIGNFYIATGQYAKANIYIKKLWLLPKKTITPERLSQAEFLQFKLDSALGNYIQAIRHFENFKNIRDSLFSSAKSKQLNELNVQYETFQRDESIRNLQNNDKSQKAALKQANMQRNITIAGIVMLLIIAGLAFNGYRNKKRSNLALQAKQTEINLQNVVLQNLVTEKDWLLKEVHHRVKNNLQIVMSLLSTQSAYLENNAALAAIRDSQSRVQAISLIHQKLYSSSNVAAIDLPSYVSDMVGYLRDCLDTGARGIRFEQLIEEVKIDLAQAVPLGLILNEAITNAIKYAFGEEGGEIIIALQMVGEDSAMLTITDNGKGLPPDFDLAESTSLGMEMMKALSKQLNGSFQIKNKMGVAITIEFEVEQAFSGIPKESFYNQ
ncbi:sensor histidine kinase [Mucilaginibacter sp. L3T2-6]|uniref:tetratricopeptide repeat-containing sensor histidine kinase n=1 Tax=Mucilaginibacter sp. L3T2-6 TaxID=3062491 RepID=UPI002675E933|nr:sensor histidine kinase [Mucilaginibacter sp. L3T2-6]MDO3641326.1 sensor histidine kinase [Mucilaginibacter sp. L3T2-6]MDV6213913.1 sensor histidine kinase [Mucilaginibacter sp. L3T2-6]